MKVVRVLSLCVCCGLLCLAVVGCKPYSLETRIAFLKRNQTAFNAYVQRVIDGKVIRTGAGTTNPSYGMPQFMLNNDVKQVEKQGDCIIITFWFMPTDCVPQFIFSPRGLDGVPEEYKSGGPKGAKWPYWKFVPVDKNWYYCEWDS